VEYRVERLDVLLQCRSETCARRAALLISTSRHRLFGQRARIDVVQVGGDELGTSTLCLDRRDGLRASFGVAPLITTLARGGRTAWRLAALCRRSRRSPAPFGL